MIEPLRDYLNSAEWQVNALLFLLVEL
jgi:hypothetical protein